jgi:hypothetical protein
MADSWTRRRGLDLLVVGVLGVVALLCRIRHVNAEVWGDEAWYFHLARTWGADRGWIEGGDNTSAQIAYRPAFFALYWPVTQLGLTAGRLVNVAASLGLVAATYWLARMQDVRRSTAASAAVLVALNPMTSRFGVILFADTTATLFALLAWGAGMRRRYGAASLAMCLAVLCKEALVAVAAALLVATWLDVRFGKQSTDAQATARGKSMGLLALPLLAVATSQATGRFLFDGRMPGWSSNQTTLRFFAEFMAGGLLLPTAVVLALRKRFLVLLPAIAMPLFYVGWGFILRRGVEGWYGVSILPLALVGHSVALQELLEFMDQRFTAVWKSFTKLLAPAALPLLAPWAIWRPYMYWPWGMGVGDTGIRGAASALELARPPRVALVSCFWAFGHYPLRPPGTRVSKLFVDWSGDKALQVGSIRYATQDFDAVVLCEKATQAFRAEGGVDPSCKLFDRGRFIVFRPPAACQRASDVGAAKLVSPAASAGGAGAVQLPVTPRKLGFNEMVDSACGSAESGRLRCRGSRAGIILDSPAFTVPAHSVVEVKLRIAANSNVEIASSIATEAGQIVSAIDAVQLHAGEGRGIAYRVAIPEELKDLRFRVSQQTATANFDVDELSVSIAPE